MKPPIWLKRLPLVGPVFWDRSERVVTLNNGNKYVVSGVSTETGFGAGGEYVRIVDGAGDVVRERGRHPFQRTE